MTDVPAGFYPLIVRGGPEIASTYEAGVLTVHFLPASVAAGDPATYVGLPPGSAAWVDRPLNADEPGFLEYATADAPAVAEARAALSNPERFWAFACAYDATRQCFVAVLAEPVPATAPPVVVGATDHTDQLALLGEQVVAALTATYDPHGDSTLALALHPGQALADDIVQDGVTNVLRLSEWIGGQYDYPMLLKLADGTPVVSTSLGGVTAKSAYATMARWSQPGVAGDSASFPRLAQLISDVRQDIGEHPETLPFGVEPTDFALADCPAWQVFDTKISSHSEVTTTLVAPTTEPSSELWKIRAISEAAIAELPKRRLVREEMQVFSAELPSLSSETVAARLQETRELVTQPVFTAEVTDGIEVGAVLSAQAITEIAPMRAFRSSALTDLVVQDAVVALPDVTETVQLDAMLATELVYVSDLADQDAVSTATTSDSSLHVHFEFLVLTIDRLLAGRPWWHPEFLAESAWFVPGMRRGALVPDTDDPEYGRCLPQSLLLVRNVSLTGVWSDAARSAMNQSVHYFGPFLMSAAATQTTEVQSAEQTTVASLGVQVIGELCSRLPVLPPMDDPALAPTQSSGS